MVTGFTTHQLKAVTHKSLLQRTTPSTRYRSPVVWSFTLMRSLSDGERASQTIRAGEKTYKFFAISEVPCHLSIYSKCIVLQSGWKILRKIFNFFRKFFFSTDAAALPTESAWPRRNHRSIVSFSKNFFSTAAAALPTESAWPRRNRRSMVTGFTTHQLKAVTHKSLLERTTPSMRYRSPVIWSFTLASPLSDLEPPRRTVRAGEKFPTAAAPPLCEQSQPGHDESSIDRFFFETFLFDRCPAALPTESAWPRRNRRSIVSPVLQLIDFKLNAQVTTRAHNPIDQIPVTGFLPCKSRVSILLF